jgi:hypothetical protein
MTYTPKNETTEKGVLNGNYTGKTISLKSEENFTLTLRRKRQQAMPGDST